jgi:hypothetical protein
MIVYQYKLVVCTPDLVEAELNRLGRQGWKVIHSEKSLVKDSPLAQHGLPGLFFVLDHEGFLESLPPHPKEVD